MGDKIVLEASEIGDLPLQNACGVWNRGRTAWLQVVKQDDTSAAYLRQQTTTKALVLELGSRNKGNIDSH
jgi:hypothetical protein